METSIFILIFLFIFTQMIKVCMDVKPIVMQMLVFCVAVDLWCYFVNDKRKKIWILLQLRGGNSRNFVWQMFSFLKQHVENLETSCFSLEEFMIYDLLYMLCIRTVSPLHHHLFCPVFWEAAGCFCLYVQWTIG